MQVIADAFWSVWRLLGCVQCLRKTPGMWNKASGQNPHQPPPILCCRQVPPRLEQCHGTATAQCAGSKRGAHQHSTATTLWNLPVLIILSILMLALSSSLAKRCTACMGSSQVSGSMYFLLVGILTAGKAKRADERGSAELPPTHPGKHYPSLSVSWSVGRTNVPPFYKQSKRLSSKVSKNFFFRIK